MVRTEGPVNIGPPTMFDAATLDLGRERNLREREREEHQRWNREVCRNGHSLADPMSTRMRMRSNGRTYFRCVECELTSERKRTLKRRRQNESTDSLTKG